MANTNSKPNKNFKLNTILFGPPGTGKTYNTVIDAVAICTGRDVEDEIKQGNKSYQDILDEFNYLKSKGRIAFTTFHQSYGYEDFIEGIRPVTTDNGQISYEVQDGSFKKFCKRAVTGRPAMAFIKQCLYKYIKEGHKFRNVKTEFQVTDTEPFGGKTKIDVDGKDISKGTQTELSGNIYQEDLYELFSGNYGLGNYGEIKSPQEITDNYYAQTAEQRSSWLYPIYEQIKKDWDSASWVLNEPKSEPYVYIIDEINRGNISKIFGELITLIEDSKRLGASEAMKATLPYSGEEFGVPKNVYILGTMNTADRSIAIMDTALRRRFDFREMMPDPSLFHKFQVTDNGINVDIETMLSTMNDRIEYLLDREHTLGHAFFMPLKKTPNLATLADIFRNKIIPLLQEYFFDDYEKIQYVLGDNAKSKPDYKFIEDNASNTNIFKGKNVPLNTNKTLYSINEDAFNDINSYKEIY